MHIAIYVLFAMNYCTPIWQLSIVYGIFVQLICLCSIKKRFQTFEKLKNYPTFEKSKDCHLKVMAKKTTQETANQKTSPVLVLIIGFSFRNDFRYLKTQGRNTAT